MDRMRKISVVIPCHNARAFIADALASALGQDGVDVECIVVDDASSDGTPDMLREMACREPRLKPLFLEQNLGPSGARNRGLEAASGEWVALLDADDTFEQGRLAALANAAGRHKAEMVFDNLLVFPLSAGQPPQQVEFFAPDTVTRIDIARYFRLASEGKPLTLGYGKPIFLRSFLDSQGLRFDTRYRVAEDFLFYTDCFMRAGCTLGVGSAGYVYRRRPASLSRTEGKSRLEEIARIFLLVLERYRDRLGAADLSRMQRTIRMLRQHARAVAFKAAIADCRWREAAGLVTRSPDILLLIPLFIARRWEARETARP
jgi:glycosyltransferase involved in cell wall biosynthesis